MKKFSVLLLTVVICTVTSMPLLVHAQSDTALQHRAEISYPTKFDKTPKPLREMFDTGEKPGDQKKLIDKEGREYRICPQCGYNMYKEGRMWVCENCGYSYVE